MAAEGGEQGLGVGVGDRQGGDPGEHGDLLPRPPLGVLGGAGEGRQRIAAVVAEVEHRAALHPVRAAPAAFGVDVALEVAVAARIGVDDAADGAVLGRHLGLDAAPRAAVAGDHHLAGDVDAAQRQLLVVVGHAVVDVDELAGHVAVDGVGVVGREVRLLLRRGRVAVDRRLDELRGVGVGSDHLEHPGLRGGEEHVEGFDPRVVAPGPEELEHELGVGAAVGRAHVMGPGGHPPHPFPEVLGVEDLVEALLQGALLGRRRGAEAAQRRRRGLVRQEGRRREERQGEEAENRALQQRALHRR